MKQIEVGDTVHVPAGTSVFVVGHRIKHETWGPADAKVVKVLDGDRLTLNFNGIVFTASAGDVEWKS